MPNPLQPAGFFRRLGALIYDGLIAIALAFIAIMFCLIALRLAQALGLVMLAPNMSHSEYLSQQAWPSLVIWFSLLGFYLGFWCRVGQTLGMRAWRLRVQNANGSNITLTQASIRFATAAFGLGNLMVLFDKKKRAFQDYWARCEVVVLAPPIK